MRRLRVWYLRFVGLFHKTQHDRDLAQELESHLQLHTEDNLRSGMAAEEARRLALIKLGGVEQIKEGYRDRHGIPWIETLLLDVRFGLRMLRKNTGFTIVAILTLSLGIGANTAVFSIVNGLFLRPLPVRAPEQIAFLAAERKDISVPTFLFSYPGFLDFQKQTDTFSDLFAYYLDVAGFSAGGRAEQIQLSDVTGNYFPALGVKPALGRFITPDDDRVASERTMVLGYSFWQKRFGADPNVLDKQILVNGKPARIIGVAPREFRGLYMFLDMDGYLPIRTAPSLDLSSTDFVANRSGGILRVLGRLKPGVSLAQAQSSVEVIAGRLAEEYPTTDKGISVRVYPEKFARPQPYANNVLPLTISLFLTLSVLVLLLACMNVANILLARAMVRQREMAIRMALGSGTARIIRQMLTETMLLSLFGGVGGVLLSRWGIGAIGSIRIDQNIPFRMDFSFDWRVFAYAFGVAVISGIVVGLVPAIGASRRNLNSVLHEGGRSDSAEVTHHRMGSILVVAQIAGSLMLLVVAGLFVRSLLAAERMYLGFDPDRLLNVVLDPGEVGYDKPRTIEFFRQLEDGVRSLPGVRSLSQAYSVPMGIYGMGRSVYIEGHPPAPGHGLPAVGMNRIDESYLQTMRIPLLRGREFKESDDANMPLVAVINQTMANRFWPAQDPIGRRFSVIGATGPFIQIVGMMGDGKYGFIAEDPQPFFYVPLAQSYSSKRVLEIRSSVPPESLILQVRQVIHSIDPGMPISDLETMRQSVSGGNGLFIFRLGVELAATLGALGLILAVVGVYGVLSYTTTRRTQEIGIRMSLGATRRNILELCLRQGVSIILPGVFVGLILAWSLTRAMASLLVGVGAADPTTYASATLVLLSTALIACYIPARRATRVDPMVAMRHE